MKLIKTLVTSWLIVQTRCFNHNVNVVSVRPNRVAQRLSSHAARTNSLLMGRQQRPTSKDEDAVARGKVAVSLSQQSSEIQPSQPPQTSWLERARKFTNKNFFLMGMFAAVGLARIAPWLGTNGGILRPELVIGKYGVTFVFLLSGLSRELSQLSAAASNYKLNFLIQICTFLMWPFLVGAPLRKILGATLPSMFPAPLLDGLLILSCLPTTVNMCVILTSTAGGNSASALWNAIISNMAGIFITPALLFRFFGATIQLPFLTMFFKLCNKVLLPVFVGQVLRFTPAKRFYQNHSKIFKRAQEVVLLSILWNAFCTAITNGIGIQIEQGLSLAALLPVLHIASLGLLFQLFALPVWGFTRGQTVAAMFCASQKTLAFGLPLVNTIFEGNPNLATYCAPLMLIHPLQLMIGSALIPRLEKYTSNADQEEGAGYQSLE